MKTVILFLLLSIGAAFAQQKAPDRLLDPAYAGVSLSTLSRAAMVLGKRLKV